jgi:hypothetical protein
MCGFDGTIDFGGGVLGAANDDLAIAKFDPSGKHVWSHRYGSDGSSVGPNAVAVGNLGEAWVVGYLTGTVDLGQGPITSAGGEDAFIARFDP